MGKSTDCPHVGSHLSDADIAIDVRLAKSPPLLKRDQAQLPEANGGTGSRLERRVEGRRKQEAEEEHTSEDGVSTRKRTDGGKSRSDYVTKSRYQFGEPDDFQQKVDANLYCYEQQAPKDDDEWDGYVDVPHYTLDER